jgi:ABC-type dipeptide/oligopeptide/nickel transport system ATPase component
MSLEAEPSPAAMTDIRRRRIATILHDPMASLDPLFSIYRQGRRGLRGRPLRLRNVED